MKKKVVNYTLDTLPPLTDAQRKHLEGLARHARRPDRHERLP